jgi:hypothetical protein
MIKVGQARVQQLFGGCLYTLWLHTDHVVMLAPRKKESGTTFQLIPTTTNEP